MGITHYFAEKKIRELPEFPAIAKRYPHLEFIDDYRAFRMDTMHREKECVVFARKRGPWMKPFYCYHHNHEYRYLSLDIAEGCAFDCVYCYLQSHLNHGALVLFVDTSSLVEEVQQAGPGVWISTGLLTDSLLAESQYPVLARISSHVPPGSIMEVRSKSSNVACLEPPEIDRSRVVISWSINPAYVAQRFEYGAAPLEARLQAAKDAIAMGYRVAFHLDPVFYYEHWKKDYADLMSRLDDFSAEKVAFLSLGLFRYTPDLGAVMRQRFPFHEALTGEFFPDSDGKYHYFRAIRREMHEAFAGWLASWKKSVPVFWSMEPDSALVADRS